MFALAFALFLALPGDADRDRDGLTDFQEVHKYGTNPAKADSDGDGTPDGDWLERREYAYTVRAVVHVMKPVTLEYLDDDFQDARLLDEGEQHVELEVILYPFNTVHREIGADGGWRKPERELKRWLEPGPTSDWTPDMRKQLLSALEADGIDVDRMGDREVVERVSRWLMDWAEYHDGFSSFITSFDREGRPYLDDELRDAVQDEPLGVEEQWEREVSARGMFEHKTRGSCTSSAIYISGCMRAVGIPTRTVLCIPLVDANDERERRLAERLEHNQVRRIVTGAAEQAVGSWTSHTFNEVWVDGRWRRLNYSTLGQEILDRDTLGLMIHVATFHDWADARMPETVGRRQGLHLYGDLFGGANPYSTISLRDQFGVHCPLQNPEVEHKQVVVDALHWTDDPALPADILAGCESRGRFGLIARVQGVEGDSWWREFLSNADLRVTLEAEDRPRLGTSFDAGCFWGKNDGVYIYMPFGAADRRDLVQRVDYTVAARNERDGYAWSIGLDVRRE